VATINGPTGVALSPDGNTLYFTEEFCLSIRALDQTAGTVRTIAGSGTSGHQDGTGTEVRFLLPHGLAVSPDDTFILVADTGNHVIRKVVIATGVVTTLCGTAGQSGYLEATADTAALLNNVIDLALTADGATAYFADFNTVRSLVVSTGITTLIAGSANPPTANALGSVETGGLAVFNYPHGLACDDFGRECGWRCGWGVGCCEVLCPCD